MKNCGVESFWEKNKDIIVGGFTVVAFLLFGRASSLFQIPAEPEAEDFDQYRIVAWLLGSAASVVLYLWLKGKPWELKARTIIWIVVATICMALLLYYDANVTRVDEFPFLILGSFVLIVFSLTILIAGLVPLIAMFFWG